MSRAKVTFHKCVQDMQELATGDETMVSRVFFTLEVGGKKYEDLYADLKQTVGADFESGPIEVSKPHGYDGPFNYEAFRQGAENYYRSLVGSRGKVFRIEGGNARMYNNTFNVPMLIDFDIKDAGSSW